MPIKTKLLPSREYFLSKIKYDPDTGIATWLPRPATDFASYNAYKTWNSRFSGKEAGWKLKVQNKIYILLTIDYKAFLAHRVIWKIMTGNDPVEEIDHEDGDGTNNIWTNLREANRSQQNYNKITKSDSLTRIKNVRQLPGGKFQAYIKIDGKFTSLGTFYRREDASVAAYEAAKRLHGEFANQGIRPEEPEEDLALDL